MRRSDRSSGVPAPPYRDFVWLAYLALPATEGEERRLAVAHRLAATALSRTGDDVRAFLRTVLRTKIRPWSGLFTHLDAMPALTRSADAGFTRELNALPAPTRAAYALLVLEGRSPDEVSDLLDGAGVPDPEAALQAVAALEARVGSTPRPALDPTLARMYGRPAGRLRVKALSGVLLCALAAVTVLARGELDRPGNAAALAQGPPEAGQAPAGAWRGSTELDLAIWPARGSLVTDRRLVARAQRAWGGGGAQLLFAGQVDEARIVLLHRPEQVARYTELAGSPALEVLPQPRTKADGTSPLKLRTTARGSRYLVPPWVREVSTTPLRGPGPRWRRVAIQGGVTQAIAPAGGNSCWRGPVLRLRAPEIFPGMPYTMLDFGRLSLANAHYEPPPANIDRFVPGELGTMPGGFTAWKALGCAIGRPAGEIQGATAWEFWAGRLPEMAYGRWICLRLTDATGGSSVRGILLSTVKGRVSAALTGVGRNTWDCSRLHRDVVAGAWWKAPSGKRYYVAAGSRRIASLSLDGRRITGGHVFAPWARGSRPLLSAVNKRGARVSALP
ncbi:MAG: hypothetical protein ABIQ26_24575 [Streptosporangiaceae bacterium]